MHPPEPLLINKSPHSGTSSRQYCVAVVSGNSRLGQDWLFIWSWACGTTARMSAARVSFGTAIVPRLTHSVRLTTIVATILCDAAKGVGTFQLDGQRETRKQP